MQADPCDRANRLLWLAGSVWTLPNTLLGVVLGLLNGTIPQFEAGAVNFYMRRGMVGLVCNKLGISAFTVGDCVLYSADPTPNLRVHEGRHIAQYHALGLLFLPAYFLLLAFFGYEEHPLEQDARLHERTVCGCEGPSRLRAK
ncbi:MAG: hypothetical protein ACR2IE_04120 [Candidatus Sumerlaeaceae bacterium]